MCVGQVTLARLASNKKSDSPRLYGAARIWPVPRAVESQDCDNHKGGGEPDHASHELLDVTRRIKGMQSNDVEIA